MRVITCYYIIMRVKALLRTVTEETIIRIFAPYHSTKCFSSISISLTD